MAADKKREKVTTEAAEAGDAGALLDAAPAELAPTEPAAAEPQMTAQIWARGRREALVHVFVRDVSRDRVEKRSKADWDAAYQAWLAQPR